MTAGTVLAHDHLDRRKPVEVSDLHRADWRTLRTMRLLAVHEAPHAFVPTWMEEWRQRDADWLGRFLGRRWVAARAGTDVVGIACLAPPDLDAPHGHFVESVWVEPMYRWQGLLRHMLDRLETYARKAEATELRLWVLDTNESAADAYVKLGFNPVIGREQPTTKPREDMTFVMEQLFSRPIL